MGVRTCTAGLPAIINANVLVAQVGEAVCHAVHHACFGGDGINGRAYLAVGDIAVVAVPATPPHWWRDCKAVVKSVDELHRGKSANGNASYA